MLTTLDLMEAIAEFRKRAAFLICDEAEDAGATALLVERLYNQGSLYYYLQPSHLHGTSFSCPSMDKNCNPSRSSVSGKYGEAAAMGPELIHRPSCAPGNAVEAMLARQAVNEGTLGLEIGQEHGQWMIVRLSSCCLDVCPSCSPLPGTWTE